LLRQETEIEFATSIACQVDARRINIELAKGRGPAKQRTQLEIDENPFDGDKRFAIGFVQFEAIDLQAEHEWIDRDLLQFQLDAEVVPNGVRGRPVYQPGGDEETEHGIHDDCDRQADQRLSVALQHQLRPVIRHGSGSEGGRPSEIACSW
jgi:hypothetical protein